MNLLLGKTADACHVNVNLPKLIDARALVQGSSGSGKSWLLRVLVEQAAGHVQTIVLDPEGEFATLREKLDMVLVGRAGEVQTDPRAAALLARKLKELRLSAVIDLYDLQLHDRRRFVRLFLDSLLNLPRSTWAPTLVVLDEAHKYCPERGSGEAESTQAVIDLCSQGRKRGLCAVLATQRLSKLHKDAAAELLNVFIGRTTLDVDQKRAADAMGMPAGERSVFRDLDDGWFYSVGPALSRRGVMKFQSQAVRTTHPKAGQRHAIVPPKPSATIKRVLGEFADLPQQAAEEIKNLADAMQRIAELERTAKAAAKPLDARAIAEAEARGEAQARRAMDRTTRAIETTLATRDRDLKRLAQLIGRCATETEQCLARLADFQPLNTTDSNGAATKAVAEELAIATPRQLTQGLTAPQQRIIDTIFMLGIRGIAADREAVARWMGLHPNGGRYGRDLAHLRAVGYLEGCALSETARRAANAQITGLAGVSSALPDQTKKRVLEAIAASPAALTRESLAESLGLHPNGGRYGRDLAWLRTMGVITAKGAIQLTDGALR